MGYEEIIQTVVGLAGLGSLISILVNLGKLVGIVKDGTSDMWFKGLNLLAFIAVAIVYWVNVPVDFGQVDEVLKVLASVLGLVVQLFGGKVAYNTIKGTPFVGFSYS